MKKSLAFVAGGLLAFSLTLTGCGNSSAPSNSSANISTGNEQVVKVTATNFSWTLDKPEVKAGQPVKFVLTDKEGIHGFLIEGTNINQTITPGADQTVIWNPDKPGTYNIVCSVMCGSGHGSMKTTIKVN